MKQQSFVIAASFTKTIQILNTHCVLDKTLCIQKLSPIV